MSAPKLLKAVMTLSLALLSVGCMKGPKGDPGAPGGGRITATMNCSGVISGLSGGASALNGLEVEYDAVLTSGGDVYATAAVIDDSAQTSGTAFYAAGQNGSSTGTVLITADYHSTADAGYFNISLNRTTLVTTVVYTDASLGIQSPVVMNFTAAACSVQAW